MQSLVDVLLSHFLEFKHQTILKVISIVLEPSKEGGCVGVCVCVLRVFFRATLVLQFANKHSCHCQTEQEEGEENEARKAFFFFKEK